MIEVTQEQAAEQLRRLEVENFELRQRLETQRAMTDLVAVELSIVGKALSWLVNLKTHKEAHGATVDYLANRDLAWEAANEALSGRLWKETFKRHELTQAIVKAASDLRLYYSRWNDELPGPDGKDEGACLIAVFKAVTELRAFEAEHENR
jgi:hypothetical protein